MNIHLNYFKKTVISENNMQYALCLLGIVVLVAYCTPKQNWLRIFGRGIMWKHKSKGLRFSQRNGYEKYWKIGEWNVEWLKRS
jgi:hypothetical protein